MEGPGTDEAGGKTPWRGRRVIEQTPPITRKAAADQVVNDKQGNKDQNIQISSKGNAFLFHSLLNHKE